MKLINKANRKLAFPDGVNFHPGVNEVPVGVVKGILEGRHGSELQVLIDLGQVELKEDEEAEQPGPAVTETHLGGGAQAEVPPPPEPEPEAEPDAEPLVDGVRAGLQELPIAAAEPVIAEELDPDVLRAWAAADDRVGIRKAIAARLEQLGEG